MSESVCIEKNKIYITAGGSTAYCENKNGDLCQMSNLVTDEVFIVFESGEPNKKVKVNWIINEASFAEKNRYILYVMQEFTNGKDIEVFNFISCKWEFIKEPIWDWSTNVYRVKPLSKREPLTYEDFCYRASNNKTMWIRIPEKYGSRAILINNFDEYGIIFETIVDDHFVKFSYSYDYLSTNAQFLNGTPCCKTY